jgi:hypothetical protein
MDICPEYLNTIFISEPPKKGWPEVEHADHLRSQGYAVWQR